MSDIKYYLAVDPNTKEDIAAWANWLSQDPPPWLTMGPLVKEYEDRWANQLGRRYAVACNSGSSANFLMAYTLLRFGQLKNKKVIVPSAGWVTSIAPFMQLGFGPIMCEADPDNWGLDPVHLEELLQKHSPSTVMLVQVLGVPAHMEHILDLKKKYGFFLLEDTCAAIGSQYQGRKAGTFGDMSSISTFYGHQLSTLEGGIVTTDSPEFYDLLVKLRSHGWVTPLGPKKRFAELEKYGIEDIGTNFVFVEPGLNLRFIDTLAFLGIRQLDRMDWLVQRRFANHQTYKQLLGQRFQTQKYNIADTVCSIHFCALANNYQERNRVVKSLEKAGIETRPFTSGNQGRHPYWFREYSPFEGTMADRLYQCGFFLPNHPYLQLADLEFITNTTLKSVKGVSR